LVARAARADDLDRLPGTFDDPVRMLEVFPGIELVPVAGVPSGIAIRDAAPDQNKLLFDGFEVPALLVGGRSAIFADASRVWVEADGFGVEHGRATGGLVDVFSSVPSGRGLSYEVTPLDASVMVHADGTMLAFRGSYYRPVAPPLTLDTSAHDISVELATHYKLGTHWNLSLSDLVTNDFGIAVATLHYERGPWRGTIAAAIGYDDDTRAEIRRDLGHAAGLYALEVRAGGDTQYTGDHANEGVWAATTAALTQDIVFIGGVRGDAFDSQLTVQPRGMLAVRAGETTLRLAAGAYRRPAAQVDVTPQRATQLALSAERYVGAVRVESTAYYVDRERLMLDDGHATGVATNVGLELRAVLRQGPWRARLGASVSHATRADSPTATSHAADYDLPVHVDALASWSHAAWVLGARVQLRAGLPYTPVVGSVYDAESDSFSPLYGKVMSQRAPWRRELDLRVDRQLLPRLRAYLDVAIDGGTLGYTYSYDDSQRLAVHALPVLPWLGIAGTL
jgi:hypothetical protein